MTVQSPAFAGLTAPASGAHPAATRRVSVVMPVYNAADTLVHSIESVLAQTHADVELVVVDDGSKDDSWPLIERVADRDARIVPYRMPANGGVAAARNAGIERAGGELIAFLDSDDWWHPRKLEVQLAYMRESGARISYTAYQRVDDQGRPLSCVSPPATTRHPDMLRSNCIGNLTGIYDRSLGDQPFERVGHEDYVFWLRMVRRAGWAGCAPYPEPLAYYRVRTGSLSGDKLKAARWQWHIYRHVEKLDLLDACRYFMHYAGSALAKRI